MGYKRRYKNNFLISVKAGEQMNDDVIREIKDNSYKRIFNEPELFCQFIKDFIPISCLKDIKPEDVEDYTERFLPLISEARDSDTVKLMKVKDMFVIALIEPQTDVNYLMAFRFLEYCAYIWRVWIDDREKEKKGSSTVKKFKLPPIIPIIYYSNTGNWTAPVRFVDKVALSDIFRKYIPDFSYEVVGLSKYSVDDLMAFEDILTFLLIIDKIKKPEEIKEVLKRLNETYLNKIKDKIPDNLLELLRAVITLFLAKLNIPENEIEQITEKIKRKEMQEMFTLVESYDVQETRRWTIVNRVDRKKGIKF